MVGVVVRPPLVLAAVAASLILTAGVASADSTGSVTSGRGLEGRTTPDPTGAPAAAPRAAPAEDPRPVVPDRVRGPKALRALGSRLPAVAATNGLTARGLERLLTEDPTAWLSREGRVYFQEELPTETTGTAVPTSAMASYPTSQTFQLHSRPGAARTIFLDFDGATVIGTRWSDMISDGTHIGWDSDGSPSSFASAEHAWIQEVWREVAEAYSPFDVDVTTADPGASALRRSSSSDTTYGSHVLVTSSESAVEQACDSACLGVAWIGTFDSVDPGGVYQPAWVFADADLPPMIAAQAASHEAGHNLGLRHDGKGSASYYAGTTAWGPIMGSSRTRAISQFSRGEYVGANNTEDDFAVMQSNGLPLRDDDHGSTPAAARDLGALTSYDVRGVIETRTDADVFAIDHPCTTDLEVTAAGIGAQTTLDLSLEVLDSAGTRVGRSAPASGYRTSPLASTGMDASLRVPAGPGTYYLRVDGVGHGDPAGTGWSDFGSLGQYHLTATGCAGATPPPPAEPVEPPTTAPPTVDPTPAPVVTRPGAPGIRSGSSGRRGGAVTALARWSAPSRTGGATITRYRVVAQRLSSTNRVLRNHYSGYRGASTRSLAMRLPRGRYVFKVMAWNRLGASSWSRASRGVYAR